VVSEKIVRQAQGLSGRWCIIRPTSIWGPWYGTDYTRFFIAVAKGWYFHPGRIDPPKLFGFVRNVAFQIDKLLFSVSDEEFDGRVYYLADDYPMAIRDWANTIAQTLGRRKISTIPGPIIRVVAWVGDLLHALGYRKFPMTSFRLHNMWTDTTGVPIKPIREITGELPYSMKDGVEATVDWLKDQQRVD
jgi:nucleoside-diphosphate-sugar epimerase